MRSTPAAIVAPPAVAAAAVVAVVLAVVGLPLLVVLACAVAVAAVAAARLWLKAPQSALGALGARPMNRDENPRLANLLEGLCTTHGLNEPAVHVVETPAINAATVGLGRATAHLVLTRGALSGLDRLELEAVIARELCEIRRGRDGATVLASVARLPAGTLFTNRLWGRLRDDRTATTIDLEAVRLTSYPPALVSALSRAADAPTVDAVAAVAHLWFLGPQDASAVAGTQPPITQRLDVLREV